VIVEIVCAAAAGYQLLAAAACVAFRRQAPGARGQGPAASILKPVHGVEPSMREAIASHASLPGDYELLCGVRAGDPAASLLAEFPKARLVESMTQTANGKVGVLMDLARVAKHEVLVVNDADIRVEPEYLESVTAPLADPRVGLVTCLYRAEGATFPARFEALGIATDFAPSVLVARLAGVDEFAMGSTMAFRRADLERIGGFAAIADYLADDFQLGRRIHALGLKCVLSRAIVTTHLDGGWREVWRHQVRWARTIRVSKPWGYAGLPVTFATVWAAAAALSGSYAWAAGALAARMALAAVVGAWVLRSTDAMRLWPLVPLRDLFGAAVWAAGLFGRTVVWRGRRLRLDALGRITGS
jgi:ceramide glucosyltransferase